MALRRSGGQLYKGVSQACPSRISVSSIASQKRHLATPVPPVTQDATGSKGPTAMVFMNMGGPATLDEVGDFLSRLFVC